MVKGIIQNIAGPIYVKNQAINRRARSLMKIHYVHLKFIIGEYGSKSETGEFP
ncbi:hypothetical protein YC2023_119883 [Brassica napus]